MTILCNQLYLHTSVADNSLRIYEISQSNVKIVIIHRSITKGMNIRY